MEVPNYALTSRLKLIDQHLNPKQEMERMK